MTVDWVKCANCGFLWTPTAWAENASCSGKNGCLRCIEAEKAVDRIAMAQQAYQAPLNDQPIVNLGVNKEQTRGRAPSLSECVPNLPKSADVLSAIQHEGAVMWAEYMGAMRRVTELEGEKAALCEIIGAQTDSLAELRVQLAAFTAGPVPADLPDPPRRPDGTLQPQAKPWTPPKPMGDGRRIGG